MTEPRPTLPRSRFSANLGTLFTEFPLPRRLAEAKACGFDVVELQFPYGHSIAELKDAIDAAGLRVNNINAPPGAAARGDAGLAGMPGREDDFRRSFEQAAEYALGLGAGLIHVMSGAPDPADREGALATYIANIRRAAREAAGVGLTLMLEPLNHHDRPGNLVSRSDEIVEHLGEIGEPNVKLLFDFYHIQIMEGDLLRRFERHLPHIGHVQIANAPHRTAPDVGEINFPAIFEAIAASTYAGPIGLEYKPRGATAEDFGWMERFGIR
ncbi:MAG: TIM barrel protein [Microvirga sp.]|nr:TIM barrel protein [Microvirga sp.]